LKEIPQSNIDWLTLGQHYGLPTRLLDWTENPLVGLFFALCEDKNTESHVWIIEPFEYSSYDDDLLAIHGLRMFFPKVLDDRIFSQRGCFSIQPFPKENKPFLTIDDLYNSGTIELNNLIKVIIPNDKELKNELLMLLIRMGIDNSFIYPDLTGLCKQIKYDFENGLERF